MKAQDTAKIKKAIEKRLYNRQDFEILVIDSNSNTLQEKLKLLKRAGFQVSYAASGEEGFDILLERKPHVVLVEYDLSDLNGQEFLNEIRIKSDFENVTLSIIIITSNTIHSKDEIESEILFSLGLDFLLIPFSEDSLLSFIDSELFKRFLVRQTNDIWLRNFRSKFQLFFSIIENAKDLIFTLDANGKFRYINQRLRTFLGFLPDECVKKKFLDLINSEDKDKALIYLKNVNQGKTQSFEIRMNHQNGKVIFVWINMVPIYQKGRIEGATAIARDLTEKKKLEKKITELNDFIESIIQSIESGLIVVDLDLSIIFFNRSVEEILGYKFSEVIGKRLNEIVFPRESYSYIEEFISKEDFSLSHETELINKDGKIILGFTVSQRINSLNEKVGYIISFKDISKIKAMQLELLRIDKLSSLGRLSEKIVHKIGNLAQAIKICAKSISEEIGEKEECKDYLKSIISQAEYLHEMKNRIKSYAEIESTYKTFYSIDEIIKNVLNATEDFLKGKNIRIIKDLKRDIPKVYVDSDQIENAFENIVENACEAMNEGGSLKITAKAVHTIIETHDRRKGKLPKRVKESSYLEIKIMDTGIGIEAADIDRVFDPFFSKKNKRIGLGLSIAHRIIEENDGKIEVESKLGEGTTFSVLLPTEKDIM